jgi:hypothetical protein
MTVKRILAALAVLGALAGGTAAATTTGHAGIVASAPNSWYHM